MTDIYWMILLITALNSCLLNNFSKSFPKESHRMHNVIYKWCHSWKILNFFISVKIWVSWHFFFPSRMRVWSFHPSLCWPYRMYHIKNNLICFLYQILKQIHSWIQQKGRQGCQRNRCWHCKSRCSVLNFTCQKFYY